MEYELTRYGEEYLETGPARIQKRREISRSRHSKSGDKTMYSLHRKLDILENVRIGVDPIVGSYDVMRESPSISRAQKARRKDLATMLKANLIRKVEVSNTTALDRTSGWEQKIQYDLGHRSAQCITASQEEYEKPYLLSGEPEGTKLVKYGTAEVAVRPGETVGDAVKRLGKFWRKS